jgi:hypothetical protein
MSFFDQFTKDPLSTAATAAALYYGSPMALEAMGGMGGMGGADVVGGGAEAFGSPTAAGMGEQMGDFVPEKGLLSGMPSFKDAASYAKPVSESLVAANMAKGLLGSHDQQVQSHAPQSSPNASQTLAQLYQPYQMQQNRNRVTWG